MGRWQSKESVLAEAKKFRRRSDFIHGSNGAYSAAVRYGWVDEACAHMPKPMRWTKESAQEEARKYSSKSEFREAKPGCVQFAMHEGLEFFEEITQHMKPLWERKWTFEACKQEAKKYCYRKDFDKGCTSAYQRARANGWLDEICAHMDRKSAPWTVKQNVLDEARRYNTRSLFARFSGSAYNQARANGWLEEACSHMEIADNGYFHCVYAIYNKRLKKVYIGVTALSIEVRFSQHRSRSNSTKSRPIVHERDTVFEALTDYVYTAEEVRGGIEQEFIDVFERKGFEALNWESRVGALGTRNEKWTHELLTAEAKKYQSRMEFRVGSPAAYQAAHRFKVMDVIGRHFTRDRIVWTKEMALELAKDFRSIADLKARNRKLYRALHRCKWMEDVRSFLPKFHEPVVPIDPLTGRFIKKT